MSPRNAIGPPYPAPKETALRVGELITALQKFDPDLPVLLDLSCGCCGRIEWVGRDQVTPKLAVDSFDKTSGLHIGFEEGPDNPPTPK